MTSLNLGVPTEPPKIFKFRNYYSDWRDGINFHRVPLQQQERKAKLGEKADPYRPLSRMKRSFVRIKFLI